MDEMEVTKLCLLPQKNVRSVLNRLLADGVVKIQDVPQKSGTALMYGTSPQQVTELLACKLAKSILNVVLASGRLGKMSNLTLEFNLLAL